MMETEETDETDGQSSGHRGLQAQVVLRLVHIESIIGQLSVLESTLNFSCCMWSNNG